MMQLNHFQANSRLAMVSA